MSLRFPLVAVLAASAALPSVRLISAQAADTRSCPTADACRTAATEAADKADYPLFHDLAWRALHFAPGDPQLILLLARAQSLSGRPLDALVLIARLEVAGIPTDAARNKDFERVRGLPQWRDLTRAIDERKAASARIDALAHTTSAVSLDVSTPRPPPATADAGAAPAAGCREGATAPPAACPAAPAPTSPASPPAAPASPPAASSDAPSATAAVPSRTLQRVGDAIRFPGGGFVPGGLAYDRVSHRLLVADRQAKKIIAVDEGSSRATDLVRAESAGFRNLEAIEIDRRRGNLWVVSASDPPSAGDDGDRRSAAVHLLQLISGRPLRIYQPQKAHEPVQLVDIGVTPAGSVLLLDAAGRRIFRALPSGQRLELFKTLEVSGVTSLSPTDDGRAIYVAHAGGLIQVDTATHAERAVTAQEGIPLAGIGRVRSHGDVLVATQIQAEGGWRLIKLSLDQAGRTVTALQTLDTWQAPADSPPTLAVDGGEVYYVVTQSAPSADARAATAPGAGTEVRRARLDGTDQ